MPNTPVTYEEFEKTVKVLPKLQLFIAALIAGVICVLIGGISFAVWNASNEKEHRNALRLQLCQEINLQRSAERAEIRRDFNVLPNTLKFLHITKPAEVAEATRIAVQRRDNRLRANQPIDCQKLKE